MRNPEATKLAILNVSSELFNVQGYKATSISDITKALGMTKGAVYRHFKNKAELEKASLIFMSNRMTSKIAKAIKDAPDVNTKMNAIFDYFIAYSVKSPEVGGCPLLNAAIEADDTNPELCEVVNSIISFIYAAIHQVLKNGIKYKQIKKQADIAGFSSLVFSSLEGSIMLHRVTKNPKHMKAVVKNLRTQFELMLN